MANVTSGNWPHASQNAVRGVAGPSGLNAPNVRPAELEGWIRKYSCSCRKHGKQCLHTVYTKKLGVVNSQGFGGCKT